jgi:uncharacterized membrane protein
MTDTASTDAPNTTAYEKGQALGAVPGDQANVTAAIVTINKPAQELYDFWRDFANLADVMENVEHIAVVDRERSTWTVKAPGDRVVQWDALVTEDEPGRVIGWKSADGAEISNSGRIEFTEANGRGTIVRAVIGYDVPGGAIGKFVAKLFQREPAIQARRDLRRFKMFMETGEIATSARTRAHAAEHKAG